MLSYVEQFYNTSQGILIYYSKKIISHLNELNYLTYTNQKTVNTVNE